MQNSLCQEAILFAIDGAYFVRYSMDVELLYVWNGAERISVYSALTGDTLDSIIVPLDRRTRSEVDELIEDHIFECQTDIDLMDESYF